LSALRPLLSSQSVLTGGEGELASLEIVTSQLLEITEDKCKVSLFHWTPDRKQPSELTILSCLSL